METVAYSYQSDIVEYVVSSAFCALSIQYHFSCREYPISFLSMRRLGQHHSMVLYTLQFMQRFLKLLYSVNSNQKSYVTLPLFLELIQEQPIITGLSINVFSHFRFHIRSKSWAFREIEYDFISVRTLPSLDINYFLRTRHQMQSNVLLHPVHIGFPGNAARVMAIGILHQVGLLNSELYFNIPRIYCNGKILRSLRFSLKKFCRVWSSI